MGDKNQLPSVECGAVFGELLKKESLKDNIVELDESIRFSKDTKIFELAYAINNGLDLPVNYQDFKDYETFEIKEDRKVYYKLCVFFVSLNKSAWNYIRTPNIEFSGKTEYLSWNGKIHSH